ncbi:MAG: ribonuclease PH [Candidatus Omnitrophica bacterium]|nr:ribonuclease PH [Candidatus Omnitrophota bacterium]MCF7893910.1 ribonuclease PH [Candidatus Omnitrophota bacterium]
MRDNGRKPDQLRDIKVERKFIKYAQGSCLIQKGNTKVICAANLEKKVPFFLKGSNSGWIKAEYRMLPASTENRIPRDRISGRTMEIQRLIARSLRSAVDLDKLGEKTIRVDCDVIQADGGTRTTSIVGGFIALIDCLNCLNKRNEIDSIPINYLLGATSVGLSKDQYLLDLDYNEDSQADVDMNVVMNSEENFIEIQGTGENSTFSQKDLDALLKLAKKGIGEIINYQRNLFKDIIELYVK